MIKKIIPLFVLLYIIVITAHSTPWEESVIEADDTIISRLTEIQDYKGTDKYVAKINEIKKFSQTLKKNPGNDVRINVMLISHLFRVGNIDSLKVLIEPSKKMCIEAHDENNFYYVWQSYCELFLMTGYEQDAMTESQAMLDHAELENSTIGQSSARNIIATIYMMRSDFKNAAVYYNRAVASYKKNNNMRLYYLTNINYISALIKIDSISQAKLLFNELDSICEFVLDNPQEKSIITSFSCALVLGQLAQMIAETDSDIEKSDLYIKKLYKLKKNHPEIESHLIYDAKRINARIHKDYLKELAYTYSCEKSYKKINDLINLNLLYLDKGECLDNLGLYKESLNTYKQYIAAKDSFATNRLTDQLAHLSLHNDIVRIKIERQQEKIDEKQAKLSYSIYIILILAILLTIITIILTRMHRQNREYNEQKMRYNSILDNLPASAYCKNLDGEFTFINKTMQELIGLDEKQLIGNKTSNLIHNIKNVTSEQLEKFAADIDKYNKQVIETGEKVNIKTSYSTIDGKIIHLHIIIIPIYSQNNEIVGTQGIEIDISAEINTQEKLANTNIELANIEEKYQKASLLYNQSPTGLIIVKTDGIIKETNSIANNIAGLPENETLVRKNVTDFLASDEEKQKFHQLLKERKETNIKQNIINYKGEVIPILLQSSYIAEKDEFLTFISDISAVIKVEQKAQELEQRYRNIVQLSPDGIILIDENCNILELSQAATKILNINNTSPKSLFNIINIYDQKRLKELIATINNGNDIATTEFIIENQSNSTTNVCEVSIKAIKSLNDTTLTYILNIRDITKRKLLVNNLIRSERMAGIGKLTTTIAHEINQPLLAMTFTLDNILDNIRNNKINIEYLNKKAVRIYEDIDRITHIIDQIRSYSHSNNQSTTTTFNPNISIENAANLLTSQLQSENITIYYNLDNHLPKANGNSFQFDQVIINMLTNAQEAISRRQMKEKNDYTGKITITSESNEKEIIISINDNGIGIEKDKINHLLQPFYTIKTDGSSAGIGLGICLEIIEKMNGKLEIESTLNIGTTFRIILPIK